MMLIVDKLLFEIVHDMKRLFFQRGDEEVQQSDVGI